MSVVRAAELIYSRVEPPYSLQGKSGYQTVYKDNSLSARDVALVENRIQCFQSVTPGSRRHQFFRLDQSRLVLSSTAPISTHPEITDTSRRGGVFLAHCLVIARTDLDKFEANPFCIFDATSFVEDAEEMVQRFGLDVGIVSVKEIQPQLPFRPGSQWKGSETLKLVRLGVHAGEFLQQRRAVRLAGSQEQIDEALRTVFALLPRNKRPACTFDTNIDRCSVEPGTFWALGTTKPSSGSGDVQVDAADRQVAGLVADSIIGDELYDIWLKSATAARPISSIIDTASEVQQLCRAFSEQIELPREALNSEACAEFLNLHHVRILERLRRQFDAIFGSRMGPPLVEFARGELPPKNLIVLAASASGDNVTLSFLANKWIIGTRPYLKDSDCDILKRLALQTDNAQLLFLAATMGSKLDDRARGESLARLSAVDYDQLLVLFLDPIEPSAFVSPAHLRSLLSALGSRWDPCQMTPTQFLDLVQAILHVNGMEHLAPLAQYLEHMDNDHLTKLEKLLAQKPIPPELATAVMQRRQAVGPPSNILSRLLSQ